MGMCRVRCALVKMPLKKICTCSVPVTATKQVHQEALDEEHSLLLIDR